MRGEKDSRIMTNKFATTLGLATAVLQPPVVKLELPAMAAVPDFGPNVLVFDPSTPDMQRQVDALFAKQEARQFDDNRHAVLFKPGRYELDVQVGFYTQVVGLGRSPTDVAIAGAVRTNARWMRDNNATCNFWRCAENISIRPAVSDAANVWAVSQATALRRVHVAGDVHLWDGGWSSGGFLADCVIDGTVTSGSQQQWLSRNTDWRRWDGGNWNMVFVGVNRPPLDNWPHQPYTVIDSAPVVCEKPYLYVDGDARYAVMVPRPRINARGASWQTGHQGKGIAIPIDRFHIARPDRDTAATLNAALDKGKHLLLTPGIYELDDALRVTRPGTVVLGLGYATLRPTAGTPAVVLADVGGIRLAGVLLEATVSGSVTLLQVGEPGATTRASHAADPIVLSDLFCRTGGAIAGRADTFVTIDANHVIGDNLWLWRADHGEGAEWNVNYNRNGLVVNGDDVTMYGLFVEHCQEYQTIWNGERGRVYFYQSEMPYDPPSQEVWSHDGVRGFASYKVADHVTQHEAWGMGVYSYFTRAAVVADSAFEAPAVPGVKLRHLVTVRLGGQVGSGIANILNDRGGPSVGSGVVPVRMD